MPYVRRTRCFSYHLSPLHINTSTYIMSSSFLQIQLAFLHCPGLKLVLVPSASFLCWAFEAGGCAGCSATSAGTGRSSRHGHVSLHMFKPVTYVIVMASNLLAMASNLRGPCWTVCFLVLSDGFQQFICKSKLLPTKHTCFTESA